MAMRPLGQVAGLAASLIASGSSFVATIFAVTMGRFYDGTPLNMACGLFIAGTIALALSELAARGSTTPVEVAR